MGLAYGPFLASSGQLASDSKQYLYLDPGRFLARAPYMWDRAVGAGTVSHQHIGYLFPMGPFFWLAEVVGLSDRVAQRLWLGSLSCAAGLGALWLLRRLGVARTGAFAGAIVYMLTPSQLAFTVRMSALLLPWATLPWIVGLVAKGMRTRSWREPAAVASLVAMSGSVNVSSVLLAGIAPAMWAAARLVSRRAEVRRAAVRFLLRSTVLAFGLSLWWINGLRLQGRYGLPVLQLTENIRTIAEFSLPDDILRGLGNWFFSGPAGGPPTLPQSDDYEVSRLTVAATLALPAAALAAAVLVRWRYRLEFVAFVVVGTIVGTGAWPYDDPSVVGRWWRSVAERFSAATALRNTPRVAPVIALGIAGLLASGVAATARLAPMSPRRFAVSFPVPAIASAAVVLIALTAFLPVWRNGYFAPRFERPEAVPAYWQQLADSLGRDPATTRALEIPGSPFATFRWGNTIEPITPGLTDRPTLAREVLPYGTPGTVDLLDAFDRRLQQGTFEPATLAPIARLFASGTIVVRNDLDRDATGTPDPRVVWAALSEPLAPGIGRLQPFGPRVPVAERATLLPADLSNHVRTGAIPQVARAEVSDARTIVSAAPTDGSVVIVGDGDGIVDAAAAGLVDGRGLVLQYAALDDATLLRALDDGAPIVLTDTNRRRYRNFFSSVRDTTGPTERAGQTIDEPSGYGMRLDVFPGTSDDSRSVVEQIGGRVDARPDAGPSRPEDRPARAFDGDERTSWRVGGADPTGASITLTLDGPRAVDRIRLVQPLDRLVTRAITRVRIATDTDPPMEFDLAAASSTEAGQVVRFGRRTTTRVTVEVLATSRPAIDPRRANAVGFAEIDLGVRVRETVRLPTVLAGDLGATERHDLAVVLTRLRVDPALLGRGDEELEIDRRFALDVARTLELTGTARVDPNAADSVLDGVLGSAPPGVEFSSSGHLEGDVAARASAAFDGDPTTAWVSRFGPEPGEYVGVSGGAPFTFDEVELSLLADGKHQVPTRVRIVADGRAVATRDLGAIADGTTGRADVRLAVPETTARAVRIEFVAFRRATRAEPRGLLPLGVVEVRIAGAPAPIGGAIEPACRADLIRIDGAAVEVRLRGGADAARTGLTIEPCGEPVTLDASAHEVRTARGLDTGIDIDRLVLRADAPTRDPNRDGGATSDPAAPAVELLSNRRDGATVRIDAADGSFWLVLSESLSSGWEASSRDAVISQPTMVNGYANGWLVTPGDSEVVTIDLRWTPQRSVWWTSALSLLFAAVCLLALIAAARSPHVTALESGPTLRIRAERWSPRRHTVVACSALAAASLAARLWVGIALVGWVVVRRVVPARATAITMAAAAPVLVFASRLLDRPSLVWLALGLVAVEVTGPIDRTRDRASPDRDHDRTSATEMPASRARFGRRPRPVRSPEPPTGNMAP